ncbi:hypothetical protein ACFL6U_03040 [Planctomycetota bacterium]
MKCYLTMGVLSFVFIQAVVNRGVDMYRQTFRILESADERFYDYGYHSPLHGFDLPENVLRQVYRENALRIRGGQNLPVR